MALTPLQVRDVCYGSSGQANNPWGFSSRTACRFLTYERVGNDIKPMCMKQAPGVVEKMKKSGQLPADFDKRPDNCQGYRYMKYVDQGYDI